MNKWEALLLQPDATILDALKKLNEGAKQIALIVGNNNVLLGTVTDGDIRRGILKGISFTSSVSNVMNPNPVVARTMDDQDTILALMANRRLHQLPIVNENGQLVDIVFLDDYLRPQRRENWVVLMAGGLGTRLAPLTNDCPKPLLKVGSRPILENILNSFIANGFYQFYISVNYKAEMIMDYFGNGDKWGIQIRYLKEDKRLGTAGALSLLPERPAEPVIVMNGDLLTKVNFAQALQFHLDHRASATMCVREYEYQVPYGVVKLDNYRLYAMEEKPVQRFFVSGGIYILDPEALNYIPENTYFDMPSLFNTLIGQGKHTVAFPIQEYWMDIGRMDDFNQANLEFHEVFKSDSEGLL
ncbi:nucleotidyltransferase family protein [Paenibacillus cisolokensis]|uniref:nucleotidyltransferase family protein n=1 Tax=Paenibacillus cisolokensis TaxID=1658519 RepID=UPI003D2E76CD